MRLPRFRFRLWWLMVLVAVVGLVLGVGVTIQKRQQRFAVLGTYHFEGYYRYLRSSSNVMHDDATCAEFWEKEYPPSEGGQHLHPIGGMMSKRDYLWMVYHSKMGDKYSAAWNRPWLPVSPDPLPPPGRDVSDD